MNGTQLIAWVRQHLERILSGEPGLTSSDLPQIDPVRKPGACFITLTQAGRLRGCIGSLVAHRPLGVDLLANAEAAALHDPRFSPLNKDELSGVRIEVSLLTPAQPLDYLDGEDLMAKLRPGVDGVILTLDGRRATFLPQVWEQLPETRDFLDHLCQKAGHSGDCWRRHPRIEIYHVEKFREDEGSS